MSKLESALKLVRAGRHEDALEAFEALLQEPSSRKLEVLGHRAWLYRSMGRFEEASWDYEVLVRENAEDTEAAAYLAEARFELGDFEKAAGMAVEVLRRDPMHRLAGQVVMRCQSAVDALEHRSPPIPPLPRDAPLAPVNRVIALLESEGGHFHASVRPEIGRLLYWVIRCTRPRLVLETGACIGYSALWMGQALQDNALGHLHSFDLFNFPRDYVSPVLGKRANVMEVARGHVEAAKLSQYVTFHQGDSSSRIRRLFESKDVEFELAFIDGDHRLRGSLKDWQAVDERMAEGGIVLVHDTMPQSGWLGPRRLLEELRQRADDDYQVVNLPTLENAGLGIIQKRSSSSSTAWRPSLKDLLAERLFRRRFG